jgi:pimeloyl-ACP methyl ester carboxylesterase
MKPREVVEHRFKTFFPLFHTSHLKYIPDAGHWVHFDQPQELLARLTEHLQELPVA